MCHRVMAWKLARTCRITSSTCSHKVTLGSHSHQTWGMLCLDAVAMADQEAPVFLAFCLLNHPSARCQMPLPPATPSHPLQPKLQLAVGQHPRTWTRQGPTSWGGSAAHRDANDPSSCNMLAPRCSWFTSLQAVMHAPSHAFCQPCMHTASHAPSHACTQPVSQSCSQPL